MSRNKLCPNCGETHRRTTVRCRKCHDLYQASKNYSDGGNIISERPIELESLKTLNALLNFPGPKIFPLRYELESHSVAVVNDLNRIKNEFENLRRKTESNLNQIRLEVKSQLLNKSLSEIEFELSERIKNLNMNRRIKLIIYSWYHQQEEEKNIISHNMRWLISEIKKLYEDIKDREDEEISLTLKAPPDYGRTFGSLIFIKDDFFEPIIKFGGNFP